MTEITGVVQEVRVKEVSGGRKSYDIMVAGQAYGAGLFAPKCKEGDYIKFELDESRGYKNVGRNSLRVSANKPPAEAIAAAAAAPAKSAGGYDTRQDTISRQAAMNTAIAFMTLLSANDGLGLPAATAKGKRQEAMEAMLHKYTQEFYEGNTGVAWKDISPKPKGEPEAEVMEEAEPEQATPSDDEWK